MSIKDIEKIRKEINRMIESYDLSDDELLKVSRELDNEIVKHLKKQLNKKLKNNKNNL